MHRDASNFSRCRWCQKCSLSFLLPTSRKSRRALIRRQRHSGRARNPDGRPPLAGADLLGATLTNAALTGAILANAIGLFTTFGSAFYDLNTDFTGTAFDPVAAGWRLVPEPGTALLMGLGLVGLASRRQR